MEFGNGKSVKDEKFCLADNIRLLSNEQIQDLMDNAVYDVHNASERMAVLMLVGKGKRMKPIGMKKYMESDESKYLCPACLAEIEHPLPTDHYCKHCGQHLEDGIWNGKEKDNG